LITNIGTTVLQQYWYLPGSSDALEEVRNDERQNDGFLEQLLGLHQVSYVVPAINISIVLEMTPDTMSFLQSTYP